MIKPHKITYEIPKKMITSIIHNQKIEEYFVDRELTKNSNVTITSIVSFLSTQNSATINFDDSKFPQEYQMAYTILSDFAFDLWKKKIHVMKKEKICLNYSSYRNNKYIQDVFNDYIYYFLGNQLYISGFIALRCFKYIWINFWR